MLFQYRAEGRPHAGRGPAVGLFADQEIRLLRGPLFVGEDYQTEREVVALSGSRRTESLWVRTTVFASGRFARRNDAAEPRQHQGFLLRPMPQEYAELYA